MTFEVPQRAAKSYAPFSSRSQARGPAVASVPTRAALSSQRLRLVFFSFPPLTTDRP